MKTCIESLRFDVECKVFFEVGKLKSSFDLSVFRCKSNRGSESLASNTSINFPHALNDMIKVAGNDNYQKENIFSRFQLF